MRKDDIQKLQRLISFRERQRDIAAADMEAAKQRELDAQQQKEDAETILANELAYFRESIGSSLSPEDMELAVLSTKWAQRNLEQKDVTLKKQEEKTEIERRKLLESHQKVKQMETLHKSRTEERTRKQTKTVQAELDDLSAVKEAHK
ncbi:MAG: hypothetical protein JXX29_18655 [Deltaproteobacteria bacterium]|nr:hypothetical protein [Deltaproteobacteria bacterium]MBN2673707.1 hypothetical protein [Deltaproteobacteria bacterium]